MIRGERANDALPDRSRLLIGVAHKILFSRAAFRQVLPPQVTHDPGLEALLTLFVQDGHCMRRDAFDAAMWAIEGSPRWKTALDQLGLVVTSTDYVMLSDEGREVVIKGLGLVLNAQMRSSDRQTQDGGR